MGLAAADVDSEKEILRNCIIAQAGPFKSEGRGEFDMTSLRPSSPWPPRTPWGFAATIAIPTNHLMASGGTLAAGRIAVSRP